MLRGPQTAGELRIGCERLHQFADTSAVEGVLKELAALNANVARLEGEVGELRVLVSRICPELGIPSGRV